MKQAQNYKKLFKILPITFLLLIKFLNRLKFSKKRPVYFQKSEPTYIISTKSDNLQFTHLLFFFFVFLRRLLSQENIHYIYYKYIVLYLYNFPYHNLDIDTQHHPCVISLNKTRGMERNMGKYKNTLLLIFTRKSPILR
jgi:hypothetical protein